MTIREAREWLREQLRSNKEAATAGARLPEWLGDFSQRLENELLSLSFGMDWGQLLAMLNDECPKGGIKNLETNLKKYLAGQPIEYLRGSTDFYHHEFSVGPGVLIPRVDSEVLVGASLYVLLNRFQNEK